MLLLIIRKKAYMQLLALSPGECSVPVVCLSRPLSACPASYIIPCCPPSSPTGGPVTPEQAFCWLLFPDLQKCDRPSLPSSNVPSQIESEAPSFCPGEDWLLWTGCPICVAPVLGIAAFPGAV